MSSASDPEVMGCSQDGQDNGEHLPLSSHHPLATHVTDADAGWVAHGPLGNLAHMGVDMYLPYMLADFYFLKNDIKKKNAFP